ncbi:hypothetical protein HDU67_003951 [Dinochytrium kinnereticum]|nr:hypothetical protein HDU67_003951 [Dinochytrium kinnereticum]
MLSVPKVKNPTAYKMPSSNAVATLHGYRKAGPFYIATPSNPTDKSQIVIIFGWLNGKMQYVKKYAKYYQERGHTVLVNLSTTKEFMFGNRAHFDEGVAVLERFGVLKGGGKAAVVHTFSNGGCVNLLNMTNSLKNANKALATKAIILDSNPGRGETEAAINGFTYGMKGVGRLFARGFLRIFFFLFGVWSFLVGKRETPVERGANNVVSRQIGGLEGPRLYLYSKIDDLVNYKHVEEHQETTKAGGDLVYARLFEDSEHVKHAAKYPETNLRILVKDLIIKLHTLLSTTITIDTSSVPAPKYNSNSPGGFLSPSDFEQSPEYLDNMSSND